MVFYRCDRVINRLTGFSQKRLSIGAEGSGTRAVALTLLEDNHLDAAADDLLSMGNREGQAALMGGNIDAAFFVASPRSKLVQGLLRDETIRLMSFQRATAYTRKQHYLQPGFSA